MFAAILASTVALGAAGLEAAPTAAAASAAAASGHHAVPGQQVRTRMWTVGTHAGTRPSTEVCRWTAEIVVGGRLDQSHTVEGSRAGNCRFVKAAVEAERARKVEKLQVRLAAEAGNAHVATSAD